MSTFVKTIVLTLVLVVIGGCSAKGVFVGFGAEEVRPELPNVALNEKSDGSSWFRTENVKGNQRYSHSGGRYSSSGSYRDLARD